jgi:hypothetical protein
MNIEDGSLMLSEAAKHIKDYYNYYGHQIGLELEYVEWGMREPPKVPRYQLKVKARLLDTRCVPFTGDEITGYDTGVSTASVQGRIRADLEDSLSAARRRSA